MIALDTNLLVRLYVDDGNAQSQRQRDIAARACKEAKQVFLPKSVLLEFEWALRGFYKFERGNIAAVLTHLLGLPNVQAEAEGAVLEALLRYEQGMDFADALHLASSSECDMLLTFDRRFASRAKRTQGKPLVMLAK